MAKKQNYGIIIIIIIKIYVLYIIYITISTNIMLVIRCSNSLIQHIIIINHKMIIMTSTFIIHNTQVYDSLVALSNHKYYQSHW